jgi:signal transduction histidine kinase
MSNASFSPRTAHRGLPLRWRLALVIGAVLAATVTAVVVGVGIVAERVLIDATAERLEIGAGLLVDRPRTGPPTTALDASEVARLLGGQGTAVVILAADGSTLAEADNGADPALAAVRLDPARYAEAQASGRTVRAVASTPAGPALVVAAPIQLTRGGRPVGTDGAPGSGNKGQGRGGGPPFVPPGQVGRGSAEPGDATGSAAPGAATTGNAVAQLTVSLDPVAATVASLRLQVATVGLLALIVGFLVTVVVTRRAIRPLDRVAIASALLAEGDLTARTGISTSDEIGAVAAAFDAMAGRLEAASRAQRAFAADASHELRTPLAVLGGSVDLLARPGLAPADRNRLLASMRHEVDRLDRLADDLLLLTRLESEGPVMHPRAIDLVEVAREAAEAAAMLDPGIPVRLEAGDRLPVRADPSRVGQALLNLLSNATRHATPGSDVVVRARLDGGDAAIEVANEGVPIPIEDLERLFQRFERGSRGGSGLGLPIARAIAEASGGSLAAASAGTTTRFTLRIPLDADATGATRFSAPSQ